MKKIGVIGIGNPLRQDDGVGIVLLEKLIERKDDMPGDIEYVDGGTGGVSLLHILARFDIVIIIDAVSFGSHPGESKLFKPDAVKSQKRSVNISTHESDFLKIIELSKKLGKNPGEIFVFGVQPSDVSYGTNLSPELQQKVESLFTNLKEEIKSIICKK